MEPVTTSLSAEDVALLEAFEDRQEMDRQAALGQFIHDGLQNWRQERALEELEAGNSTLREAAKAADVEYVEMLELASEADISGYDREDLDRDIERL